MPDGEDSGFTGTGEFIFKVGRYSKTGSGPSWSNEVTINIKKIVESTSNPITTPSSLTTSITSIPITKTSTEKLENHPLLFSTESASVAGVATSTASDSVVSIQTDTNKSIFYFASGSLVFLSGLGYFLHKSGLFTKLVLNFKKV